MRIHELAPGKINLCLFLGPIRHDARHELVTLYESVSLADELLIEPSMSDEVIAPELDGPNLVSEALAGLRQRGWDAPPLRIQIEKRVPIAAGMGGGSADAAALLRVAPRLAPIDTADVAALAAELGADVPAQLAPGVALGTGAGEVVSRRDPLAEHALVVLPLDERLSTPAVYAEADQLGLPRASTDLAGRLAELERALDRGARPPSDLLVNDLEPAARSLCPAIETALSAALDVGADRAMVCGSGPTVAGLYWGPDAETRVGEAAAAVAERFPRACAVVPISSPA